MHPRHPGFCFTVLLVVLLIGAPRAAAGADGHVRTESPWLREIIDEGAARSDMLRQMRDHLDASDVVVYIRCAAMQLELPLGLGGQLQFVSYAGRTRYIIAHLNCRLPREQQIALLGHELRHATEVADAASIVDMPSFGHYFASHGFEVPNDHGHATYETDAAQRVQAIVRREVLDAAAAERHTGRDR